MRYFLKSWSDGSVCLDTNDAGTADNVREMTEAEAREYYRTAETIDVINSEIADKFEAESGE